MKLALNVNIEDEYFDEVRFGVIEITPDMAKEYLSLMDTAKEVKAKTSKFFRLCVFNVDLTYIDGYIEDIDAIPTEIENDYIELDDSINLDNIIDACAAKTVGDILNVCEDNIYWDTYLKHIDIRIYTSELSRSLLETIIIRG